MNVTTSESSVWMVAANTFKEMVEEGTEGRYVVNIYPNEQLSSGDMVKGCEMLFTGVTDLDIHSAINMTGFEEKLTVVTMPWLFTNGYDSVDEVLFNGEGGEYLKDLIRAKGAEPLGLAENGFRQITNNVRPITSPDDLKGLKIRTPAITMYVDLFKLLGADPTSLSDADKEIFSNAAIEACAAEVKASRAMDDECKQQFIDAGMEITELTPDQIQAFQDAVKPIYDQYTDIVGADALAAFGYQG